MKLNDRLSRIAGQIREGETMADIGTDHGFLPIWLSVTGKCPHVILTDISGPSLAKALTDCSLYDAEQEYDVREGDGLTVLKPGEVDAVVIAGMGGMLIADILEKDPALTASFRRFVLQPRNGIGKLRARLAAMGLRITKEQLAKEGKFLCTIITAEPSGEPSLEDGMAAYEAAPWAWDYPESLSADPGEWTEAYLVSELAKYRAIFEKLPAPGAGSEVQRERIQQYIDTIEQRQKEMGV